MTRRRVRPRSGLLMLSCFLVFATAGCGKKAPPRPPQRSEMPAVRDLRAAVSGSDVVLTWSVPAKAAPVAGFNLYRSRMEPGAETCPACPRQYVLVQKAAAARGATSFRVTVQGGTEKGRFFYRVIPYDSEGLTGPESNEAEITVP